MSTLVVTALRVVCLAYLTATPPQGANMRKKTKESEDEEFRENDQAELAQRENATIGGNVRGVGELAQEEAAIIGGNVREAGQAEDASVEIDDTEEFAKEEAAIIGVATRSNQSDIKAIRADLGTDARTGASSSAISQKGEGCTYLNGAIGRQVNEKDVEELEKNPNLVRIPKLGELKIFNAGGLEFKEVDCLRFNNFVENLKKVDAGPIGLTGCVGAACQSMAKNTQNRATCSSCKGRLDEICTNLKIFETYTQDGISKKTAFLEKIHEAWVTFATDNKCDGMAGMDQDLADIETNQPKEEEEREELVKLAKARVSAANAREVSAAV